MCLSETNYFSERSHTIFESQNRFPDDDVNFKYFAELKWEGYETGQIRITIDTVTHRGLYFSFVGTTFFRSIEKNHFRLPTLHPQLFYEWQPILLFLLNRLLLKCLIQSFYLNNVY